MNSKIIFNGQAYNSLDEMPADARQAYQQAMGLLADADQNGIPDILEGGASSANIVMTTGQTQIVHDGKVYSSVDELPPEVREKYQKAMQALADAKHIGTPDRLEGVTTQRIQIKKTIKLGSSSPKVASLSVDHVAAPARDNSRLLTMAAIICF